MISIYTPPKNLSSILLSNHVWWSSIVPSPSSPISPWPNLGAQPTLSQRESSSGGWPLAAAAFEVVGDDDMTAPFSEGGGRSYLLPIPSS